MWGIALIIGALALADFSEQLYDILLNVMVLFGQLQYLVPNEPPRSLEAVSTSDPLDQKSFRSWRFYWRSTSSMI